MTIRNNGIYSFGNFRLVTAERRLLAAGRPIELTPKAYDLLQLLVESPGHLLGRQELINALWPHAIVEEHNLTWNLSAVRRALGDDGEAPRYIETVRGHGYRFIAPVLREGDAQNTPKPAPAWYHKRWGVRAAIPIVALSCLSLAAYIGVTDRKSQAAHSYRPTVAVLGFRDLSNGADTTGWIGAALAEMINTELGAGGVLQTVPAAQVQRARRDFKLPEWGPALSAAMLARLHVALGADYLVSGAYLMLRQDGGSHLRVDVQLIDLRANAERPNQQTLDAEGRDLFALVSALGGELRTRLGVRALDAAQSSEVAATVPVSSKAARAYALGVTQLVSGDVLAAKTSLVRATAIEPQFPLAHSALARAWLALGDDAEAQKQARQALRNSAGLSQSQRLLLVGLQAQTRHDWQAAVSAYRSLFAFDQASLQFGLLLADAQTKAGNPRAALSTIATLRKLPEPLGGDPRIDLGAGAAYAKLYDYQSYLDATMRAALAAGQRGNNLLQAEALSAAGDAKTGLNDYRGALGLLGRARRLYVSVGGDAFGLGRTLERIGNAYDALGRDDEAVDFFQDANESFARIGNLYWQAAALNNIAAIYYHRGELDTAGSYYQRALSIFRQIHRLDAAAIVLNNLGSVLTEQGDLPAAISRLDESLSLRRRFGAHNGQAIVLLNLGVDNFDLGRMDVARDYLGRALKLYRQTGAEADASDVLSALADVDLQQNRVADAGREYRSALDIRRRKGIKIEIAASQCDLARVALVGGDAKAAARLSSAAVAAFRTAQAVDQEAAAHAVLGLARVRQGRYAEATAELATVTRLEWQIQSVPQRLSLDTQIARLQSRLGEEHRARTSLSGVLARSVKLGLVGRELEARLALAAIDRHHGVDAALRQRLERLAVRARGNGYLLIAQRARKLQAGGVVAAQW